MSHGRRVLAWVGATLVGAILALELGIKLYFFGLQPSPKELLVASENSTLVYELAPGVEATYSYLNPHQRGWEYRVRVGEDGFRSVPALPDPGAARIVVLGDSYAFGYGVDDDETFAQRLAELLRGRAEVRNWGVPGYNLAQQVELLRVRGPEAAPDIVVVALHPNDFEPTVFDHPRQVTWVRASHVYAVVKHLLYVNEDVEASLERTRLERIDQGLAAFATLLELRERLGFTLVLFKVSCWRGVDDGEVAQLFFDARRRAVQVVDLDAAFCAAFGEFTIPDDGHPTAEGHERLALRLLPTIEKLMEGPRR
jgi:lysophospholipase L1-like esterase